MSIELMLIIEIDGLSHWEEEVINKDALRQKALEEVGFKVLRFDDSEVLNDIGNVEQELIRFIKDFEKVHPLATPLPHTGLRTPPPAGDSVELPICVLDNIELNSLPINNCCIEYLKLFYPPLEGA